MYARLGRKTTFKRFRKGGDLIRNINQQLNYAISKSLKIGESKHSAKKNGTYREGNIYSNNTLQSYKDTAKNLSNWLKEKHPEIKNVVDIKQEHIQEWINDRGKNWSARTLENHMTKIKYLEEQSKKVFGRDNVNFYNKDYEKPKTKESTRNVAFSRDDLNRLRESMKNCRSFSKEAIEITSRVGLRIDEVAHLKREDINLSEKTIFVSREGAKNGKERIVPIRDKDINYFKELLEKYPSNGYFTKSDAKSISKSIRRYMDKTQDKDGVLLSKKYEKTTDHAIRKLYATERMKELRGNEPLANSKEEMKKWNIVSKELGHGEGRKNLYNTYCKG